ncbi:MAG: hypothetical protein AAF634_17735 [Bacteroidota bacterium]
MKKIRISGFTLAMLLYAAALFSHQPNQLTYTFRFGEEISTLTIHFTPKTVLNLLEVLNPELKNASKIKLSAYEKDLNRYFEEQILLNENDLKGRLYVDEMRLTSHDAYIKFILEDVIEISNGVVITVNSLTEVYSKLENYVFVNYQDTKKNYVLSGERRRLFWKPLGSTKERQLGFMGSPPEWVLYFMVIGLFLVVAIVLSRKIR